ncbi:hypothetical protein EEB14_55310 [Rhodococcus sp. WS4]|nr:hypothetical protein EEB14_55310 [Rhodococcus sp. WS4]
MSTRTPAQPRTAAALASRRRATQAAVDRVHDAIARLHRERTPVSTAAVARHARVSRTFLYTNPAARTAVDAAKAAAGEHDHQHRTDFDTRQEASWRERALNAENGLKTANTEILTQRSRIGELLGRIRDLEAEWTEESIQRVTTENTTLKQRVRQLAGDNRALDERLTAARSNLRFQDKRIADLEVQLVDARTRQ